MTESSVTSIARYLALAHEFLQDADLVLGHSHLRSALDRAYYAMFYAAQAAIAHIGAAPPRTHRGLISVFRTRVIETGLIDSVRGREFAQAFTLRQEGTYDAEAVLEEADVRQVVIKAREFVETIERLVAQQ